MSVFRTVAVRRGRGCTDERAVDRSSVRALRTLCCTPGLHLRHHFVLHSTDNGVGPAVVMAGDGVVRSRRVGDRPGSASNVYLTLKILYRLGGAERFVDIEDVAAEAYALAPDRFGWRTRPWASWERVRTAFVHANQQARARRQPRLVVSNREGDAWRLTAAGVEAARVTSTDDSLPSEASAQPPRRGSVRSAERVRQIRRHPAFLQFRERLCGRGDRALRARRPPTVPARFLSFSGAEEDRSREGGRCRC